MCALLRCVKLEIENGFILGTILSHLVPLKKYIALQFDYDGCAHSR